MAIRSVLHEASRVFHTFALTVIIALDRVLRDSAFVAVCAFSLVQRRRVENRAETNHPISVLFSHRSSFNSGEFWIIPDRWLPTCPSITRLMLDGENDSLPWLTGSTHSTFSNALRFAHRSSHCLIILNPSSCNVTSSVFPAYLRLFGLPSFAFGWCPFPRCFDWWHRDSLALMEWLRWHAGILSSIVSMTTSFALACGPPITISPFARPAPGSSSSESLCDMTGCCDVRVLNRYPHALCRASEACHDAC